MKGRFAGLVTCSGPDGNGCRQTPPTLVEQGVLCRVCHKAKKRLASEEEARALTALEATR
jgi:hypothetical protein